jgi:hypothetical protein
VGYPKVGTGGLVDDVLPKPTDLKAHSRERFKSLSERVESLAKDFYEMKVP